MNKCLYFLLGCCLLWSCQNNPGEASIPRPTEGEENQEKREAWMRDMHRAAPGTSWKSVELQTQKRKASQRVAQRQQAIARGGELESIANGKITGKWIERGSINQAGSVFDTEYDAETDEIWVVSDGGTIWKGPRQGNQWEVVNQDLRFRQGLLKFVDIPDGRRLLSHIMNIPGYSDDDGLTWQEAAGFPNPSDGWGGVRESLVLNDADRTVYTLYKPSYWANMELYKSTDQGASYTSIHTFDTHERDHIKICQPHHSDELLLMESNGSVRISRIDPETDAFEQLSDSPAAVLNGARANMAGSFNGDITKLYIYDGDEGRVKLTTDYGLTWEEKHLISFYPWSVGIYVSKYDDEVLYSGAVEAARSWAGGNNWQIVNAWGAYYDDVLNKLHADIMHFDEFETSDGTPFLLISNHGGLCISYDNSLTTTNLSMVSLNVSQYYSVRSSPQYPGRIFAGSQDQGYQKANGISNDLPSFFQEISGDYGHLVFANGGTQLWMTYPGGGISYYENPVFGGGSGWYTVESDDESVWLPPLIESPDNSENSIYMAGGNINGGSGSHLIKLTGASGNITANQQDFNFKNESGGGVLSALEYSKVNNDRFYAATSNGRFFYSDDQGGSWEQTINFVPAGQYLYGQAIYASKQDPNKVWLGGSGYDNPAIYYSSDGGVSFNAFIQGLPNTLVYDIDGNEEETMLFAATEAGPYVYLFEDEQWYDLSGLCAPNQTYWSVQFIEEENRVRYGTYGRGVWDFDLDAGVFTNENVANTIAMNVFPNPATDVVTIAFESNDRVALKVVDMQGKVVVEVPAFQSGQQLNTATWVKGNYIVQLQMKEGMATRQLVKQ